MDIYFVLQSDTDGSLMTGQAANTVVYISKDGGAFSATTNSVSEIGLGCYKVTLTSAETEFQTLLIEPVCSGALTNVLAKEAEQDISSLATSSELDAVATTANAIKAKTDNLPASPAATSDIPSVQSIQFGLATTSDVSSAQTAIIAAIPSVQSIQSGLSTTLDVSAAQTAIIAALPSVPTASQNAAAVWNATPRTLTDSPDIQSELATYGAAKTSDVSAAQTAIIAAIPSAQTIQSGLATTLEVSAAQTAIINRGNEAWLTATGFATPTNITDAVTALEEYGDQHWQGSGGGTPGGSRPLYCNTAMLYAHWTQEKIDTWANGSQTAIDNSIEWACNKIDEDLRNAASVPFQPVPASIRDLSILAAGARLAELAGVTNDPSVNAALAYYVAFVEDYNYRANQ